ncbi:fatty acyl-AMP ligase [Microbacterium allomyrinae]|uniref:Fatty acyl-AMP ligase n=1 Tax=Microbacterium allomyrinae TaxID=2830666 RepID=A0A9X1LXP8_9MICO|nr:fatty acyl-AMP ligase [Microbacterium allomyrinae]MCC2034024.1 fatty acyl-AMP ligase [Microbacterium allomyrinae]
MFADRTTLVDGLRNSAATLGDENGITYYDSPDESRYRGYADLDLRARAIADALVRRGFGPGDFAAIGLTAGLDWADAAFGTLYAGLAFVPAPVAGYGTGPQLGDRVAAIARSAEASLFITDAGVLERLGGGLPGLDIPVVLLEDLLAEGDAEAWSPPAIDVDSIAYLLFTSGSTGDPKGVIATHGTVIGTANASGVLFGSNPSAVLVGWSPMHHIMGLLLQVIIPAVNGAKAVVTSTEQFQRRPVFWLQLISKHRGTMTAAGNFAFALCTQLATDEQIAELDLSSLTAMFSGSEPVRPETLNAFLERFASTGITESVIAPVMGMTEANLISGKFPEDDLVIRRFDAAALETGSLEPSTGDGSVEWVSCGRPSDDTTVVIVDPDTFEPVPDGTVGEIWVSSPMVSPGYFRRPDATAETFGHTLPAIAGSFMRTGDLAAVLDGQLYVTGRLKEMIIVRGRNLYPQDIEAAARPLSPAVGIGAAFELANHPSAVGVVLEIDEEALGESGEDVDALADRIRAELVTRISLPSIAVALVAQGSLPRTATGKVRRGPTRAQLEQGAIVTLHSSGYRSATLSV